MTAKEIAAELRSLGCKLNLERMCAPDGGALITLADRIEAEWNSEYNKGLADEADIANPIIRDFRERAEQAERELVRTGEDRREAWATCKRLEEQVRVARVECEKAEAALAEERRQHSVTSTTMLEYVKAFEKAEAAARRSLAASDYWNRRFAEEFARVEKAEAERDHLNTRCGELLRTVEHANARAAAQRFSADHFEALADKLEARVKDLTRQRNHANDVANAANSRVKELEQELRDEDASLFELNRQRDVLTARVKELEGLLTFDAVEVWANALPGHPADRGPETPRMGAQAFLNQLRRRAGLGKPGRPVSITEAREIALATMDEAEGRRAAFADAEAAEDTQEAPPVTRFTLGTDVCDGVLTYTIVERLADGVLLVVVNGSVKLDKSPAEAKPEPPKPTGERMHVTCPRCGTAFSVLPGGVVDIAGPHMTLAAALCPKCAGTEPPKPAAPRIWRCEKCGYVCNRKDIATRRPTHCGGVPACNGRVIPGHFVPDAPRPTEAKEYPVSISTLIDDAAASFKARTHFYPAFVVLTQDLYANLLAEVRETSGLDFATIYELHTAFGARFAVVVQGLNAITLMPQSSVPLSPEDSARTRQV